MLDISENVAFSVCAKGTGTRLIILEIVTCFINPRDEREQENDL